jgi:hypothetical protein|tara:strand:- start:3366 stop:4310 length:945 start_codon:yes stop_codon:yes gene_type:complete
MNNKFILSESEKERIRSLHNFNYRHDLQENLESEPGVEVKKTNDGEINQITMVVDKDAQIPKEDGVDVDIENIDGENVEVTISTDPEYWTDKGTLTGKVTQNKKPLPYVNLQLMTPSGVATKYGAVTNTEGKYTIAPIEKLGTYDIIASFIGKTTQVINDIPIKGGRVTFIDFDFDDAENLIDAVEIVAKKEEPINMLNIQLDNDYIDSILNKIKTDEISPIMGYDLIDLEIRQWNSFDRNEKRKNKEMYDGIIKKLQEKLKKEGKGSLKKYERKMLYDALMDSLEYEEGAENYTNDDGSIDIEKYEDWMSYLD